MAAMDYYDSSGSAWSSDSFALPMTPSPSTTSASETLEPILQAPALKLHQDHRLLSVLPAPNGTTISLSKSETNLSNLAKPFGAISSTIRPSPSLSTLHRKSAGPEHKDSTYFSPHGRHRSNSVSKQDHSAIDKSNHKAVPLAERRRSETSRYLGTDDFKSAFAINLLKLKEREKVDGEPTHQSSELAPKISDMSSNCPPVIQSQLKGISCEASTRVAKSELVDGHKPMIRAPGSHVGEQENAHNALQISSTTGHSVKLPAEALAAQIERHFNRLKPDRMEDELEARNEVISILAHQMSNQLEVNDKLLHELAALRAAYASLQSSYSDHVDELEFLKIRFRALETEREVERCRRESEDKVRGLGQLVHETKRDFCRLQAEVIHQGKRRSLQNYTLERQRNSSYILSNSGTSSSPPRRNSSYINGGEMAGVLSNLETKRSTILILSSENPRKHHIGSLGGPPLASLTSQFEAAHKGMPSNGITRNASLSQSINKPERPPKSSARSHPASPAATKLTSNQAQKFVAAPLTKVDCGTQTSDVVDSEEVEKLRQRCARLELELNESEDCRIASQDASDALRQFISSQPQSELSTIKLPPLPTDLEPEDNSDEAMSNRWHISNLLPRSNHVKSTGTGASSPYLKSPSIHGSPVFGNAFGSFSLWGRSPVLG
ncbi:hypothetical protein PCANC_07634 [Puccinia coronata f. sp. avenae]|uniref:Uncharacterized protein n=1 Tax=Puccinia coronata f. sp. avenae TaxID=200324 RepID=A0A2N5T2N3_9BASI|nr:hypothetical protein PCANC_07634 [Puccinia coronata f. sp. avenae]